MHKNSPKLHIHVNYSGAGHCSFKFYDTLERDEINEIIAIDFTKSKKAKQTF